MHPPNERGARGDAGEFHRRAHEAFLQRRAIGIDELGLAVRMGVAIREVALAVVVEAGGDDVAGAHALAVAPVILVHHLEAVARLQVLRHVDVVRKDLGHLGDGGIAESGLLASVVQRSLDDSAGGLQAPFKRTLDQRALNMLADKLQLDASRVVLIETQPTQLAWCRNVEGKFIAVTQVRQYLFRTRLCKHTLHVGGGEIEIGEQGCDGLALVDAHDLPVFGRMPSLRISAGPEATKRKSRATPFACAVRW